MIPIEVRMTGWMRYKDEQVADFSEGSLISICGDNGAGKSSIFDAITFALYGRHRLGAVGTEDLITQDADGLEVEFVFENNGHRFKVHRGRARGKAGAATSALYNWDAAGGDWVPVAGTNSTAGLQAALNNILRLSEKAFTSSFLLTQGEATQFLDETPGKRFEIISSLIDLAAYERIEKAAREKARDERVRSDDILRRLQPLADVTPESIDAARRGADDARSALELAGAALDRARRRLEDAGRFHMRTAEAETLRKQIAAAQELIARRAEIEENARKAETLAAILRTLNQMAEQVEAAARMEAEANADAEAAAAIDLSDLEANLAAGRDAMTAAQDELSRAEEALSLATRTERDAAAFAVVAKAVLDARGRLIAKRQEYVTLEAQLGDLDAVREEAESLSAIARVLPDLRVLMEATLKLEALRQADPETALKDALARQKKAQAEQAKLMAAAKAAETDLHAAQHEASASAARLADARAQLVQRRESAGEAICSRCGQPVTPEHAAAEIAELETSIAAAEALEATHAAAVTVERDRLDAARAALEALMADTRKLDAAVPQLQAQSVALKAGADELGKLAKSFTENAPPVLITLTQGQDGAGLRGVLAKHGDVPVRHQKASRRYQELLGFRGQQDAVAREVKSAAGAVEECEARAGIRLEEVDCGEKALAEAQATLQAATATRDGARVAIATLQDSIKQAETAVAELTQQRAALLSSESQKRIRAGASRDTAVALSHGLPQSLQAAALADCTAVLQQLEADRAALADAPAELERLQAAERERAAAEGELRAKESEIAAIAEEHRIDPAVAEADAKAASDAQLRAREAEQTATTALATMEQRSRDKELLHRQQKAAAERQRSFTKLARLMGKSGLQGVLVTSALETITHHANAFLGRLTGASLQLMLERGASNDELELKGIDTTCMREARSVQALSGSQKFRCAVAIAYGIGQYAGAGGMRSIVIDEGFGSLDDVGQEQMVDELKALSQHMDKVIVVSHLGVFREREHFPVQLWVEKQGNTSRIRRL